MRENLADVLRLLLVTDDTVLTGRDPLTLCQAAVTGGVTAVQLRLKELDDRLLAELARRMLAVLTVPLFLNDRLDVAVSVGAAGVHLGADDLAPAVARRNAPPGFLIGASVGSDDEVLRAATADYWGIGPLRPSATKPDAGAALGWIGAAALRAQAGERPCVLIGGIQPEDVASARSAGFVGVAVVSGILAAPDIAQAARRYATE